jgi:type I restriction enzyme S subunit
MESCAAPTHPRKEAQFMIARLQPYAEYKESGLQWVGCVPQGWDMQRTKWLFLNRKEINSDRRHTNVLSLTLRGVVNNDPNAPEGLVPKDYCTYQFFGKGDLVFKLIDLENLRTSRVGLVHEDGIMSSAYVRLIPNNPASVRFFFLQFYDLYSRGVYNQLGAGVRSTLGPSDLLNLPICLPPHEDQTAMVQFLDHANGRLERAIRAKRKVIALLHEQKQAIIHRAVTRGLDPTVPLKPSGIPWLGDIPKHWEVLRAKYLFCEVDERSASGEEELLSVSHITGVSPRSQKNITMFKAQSYVGHKLCRPGDLVVNTMWAWMAALGVSAHTGIISPAYAVYRPRHADRIVGGFIDGLLRTRSYVSNIICRSTGVRASRLRLYPEEFFRLPIIFPPASEQKQIVQSIAADTALLNTAIAPLEREIELLREYRTRLVADVVTGKLDVRPIARYLPTATDSAEPALGDDSLGEEGESAEEVPVQ